MGSRGIVKQGRRNKSDCVGEENVSLELLKFLWLKYKQERTKMSSFCRITGKARDQPKPNFFPIIPPISPADARKLCKITGRRMDDHNFVPLLEFGKRPECVRCKITGTGNVKKEMPAETVEGDQLHIPRDDYKYVAPILRKEVIEKEYQKSFEDLQKLLKRL